MGLEAVLPGPQNALYVMLCYVRNDRNYAFPRAGPGHLTHVTHQEKLANTYVGQQMLANFCWSCVIGLSTMTRA